MPNWTDCKLYVSGKPEEIKQFAQQMEWTDERGIKQAIACEAILPCPQELTDTLAGSMGENHPEYKSWQAKRKANFEKYGCYDWYEWQKENWGVKWGLSEPELIHQEPTYLEYRFMTPWNYPDKWLEKLAGKYPTLGFDLGYVLEGYEGCGRVIYEEGKLVCAS